MASDDTPVIRLHGVTAGYDRDPVLVDVSLTIGPHDFLAIIGPNGGGKTTLLKVILGLLEPWQGRVHRRGLERPGAFGYVPQLAAFDGVLPLRVDELVALGRPEYLRRREPRERTREAVAAALAQVGLGGRARTEVSDLSGGQLQRALVARALVGEPSVLCLDEPLAAVDAEYRGILVDLLKDFHERNPVILVTHDLTPFAHVVRQIACVNRTLHYHPEGRVSAESLEEVYGCPVELVSHGVPHRVLAPHDPEPEP